MTQKKEEQLKEIIADCVGRLLANSFEIWQLKHTIRCRYQDTEGNTYRMTFEKMPTTKEPKSNQ